MKLTGIFDEQDIIYIAGPMSGIRDHNAPAFHQMSSYLRSFGLKVKSPPEINPRPELDSYQVMMKRCYDSLLTCTALVALDRWQCSRGATTEIVVARMIGLKTYSEKFNLLTAPVMLSGGMKSRVIGAGFTI